MTITEEPVQRIHVDSSIRRVLFHVVMDAFSPQITPQFLRRQVVAEMLLSITFFGCKYEEVGTVALPDATGYLLWSGLGCESTVQTPSHGVPQPV